MATIKSTQIELTDSSFKDSNESQALAPMQPVSKKTSLLDVKQNQWLARFKSKFKIIKSKSAVLILIWSFLTGGLHWIVTNPSYIIAPLIVNFKHDYSVAAMVGSVYVSFAILQLFYPLAGYLADVKYGRYKCVIGSLWCFVGSCLLLGIGFGFSVSLIELVVKSDYSWWSYTITSVAIAFLGLPIIIGVFVFFSSIVAFNANVIQFGLDQLHDSPTEHLILFIHWYVLLSYVGNVIIKAPENALGIAPLCNMDLYNGIYNDLHSILIVLLILFYLFLLISLCIAFCKRKV